MSGEFLFYSLLRSRQMRELNRKGYIILRPFGGDHMTKKEIATGVVHTVPADVRKAFAAATNVLAAWNDLTPLARNEWICWITSVKKPETRKHHIERACVELLEGKRRPCCWPGCPHR